MFDFTIRNIEFNKFIDTASLPDTAKYIQGLQKNCEVYAYIYELIDAIEQKEKVKETEKEEER